MLFRLFCRMQIESIKAHMLTISDLFSFWIIKKRLYCLKRSGSKIGFAASLLATSFSLSAVQLTRAPVNEDWSDSCNVPGHFDSGQAVCDARGEAIGGTPLVFYPDNRLPLQRDGICVFEPVEHQGYPYKGYHCPHGYTPQNADSIRSGCGATHFKGENAICVRSGIDLDKNQGACKTDSCCIGNPINGPVGNKYQIKTDFISTSLQFQRTYNSTASASNSSVTPESTIGYNWTHNYLRKLSLDENNAISTVSISREDGKAYFFNQVNNSWASDADVFETLEQLQDGQGAIIGWRYTTVEQAVEDYDVNGKLLSITDVRGNTQNLSYDANNRLDRVDSNIGEFIQFAYDSSGRVSTITNQANHIWAYRYDVQNNLEFVDNPDGTTKQYHYNESIHTQGTDLPHAPTGITDERGTRYATFFYDNQGWAIGSTHANNVERVDITYVAGGNYNVTNSLGEGSNFITSLQLGVPVVTDVSGPGCSTCGNSNTSYNYDPANNNLLSRTGNTVTTKFDNYDSKGQVGCKVEGITASDASTGVCTFDPAASPNARRTDYTYDPRFHNKVTTITTPSVFKP